MWIWKGSSNIFLLNWSGCNGKAVPWKLFLQIFVLAKLRCLIHQKAKLNICGVQTITRYASLKNSIVIFIIVWAILLRCLTYGINFMFKLVSPCYLPLFFLFKATKMIVACSAYTFGCWILMTFPFLKEEKLLVCRYLRTWRFWIFVVAII